MTLEALRVAVGEKLGWTKIKLVGVHRTPHGIRPGKERGERWVVPNYPVYIALAWSLVERMTAAGIDVMVRYDSTRGDKRWTVVAGDFRLDCDSAEEGICRAFLEMEGDFTKPMEERHELSKENGRNWGEGGLFDE